MSRSLLLLCMFACLPFFLSAQNFEVGILLGTSAYSGDLNPSPDQLSTGTNHGALGIFARRDLGRFLSGRLSFTYGKLSASDSESLDESRRLRNLNFETSLIEFAAMGELHPFGTNRLNTRLSPYFFGGVAVFRFNPEAVYNGSLVELQPLGTEGQGMSGFPEKYRLTQISVPFGAGVKFRMTDRLNLGVEVGLRRTFTDYLDDVSGTYVNYNDLLAGNGRIAAALGNRTGELTGEPVDVPTGTVRGNPDVDDWYYVAGATLSYQFSGKNTKNYHGRRGKGEIGCPKF